MLLSIIIPLYNTENFISRCLESCIKQDFDENEYEIIVINDGSTDKGAKIVHDYSQKHYNIMLYNFSNQGISMARNHGLEIAVGNYIMFVDSDDFIIPYSIKEYLDIVIQQDADLACFGKVLVPENIKDSEIVNPKPPQLIYGPKKGIEIETEGKHTTAHECWHYIYKRTKQFQERKFVKDVSPGEDTLYVLEAVLSSEKMILLDGSPYVYIQRSGSIMHKKSTEHGRKNTISYSNVAIHLLHLYNSYLTNSPKGFSSHFFCHIDQFAFITLIYLLRWSFNYDEIENILNTFKKEKIYPLLTHNSVYAYDTPKCKFLRFICNHEIFYRTVCIINSFIPKF